MSMNETQNALRAKGSLRRAFTDETTGDLVFEGLGVVFSRGADQSFRDLYGDQFLPDVSQMADGDNSDVVLGTDYGIGDWLIPGKTTIPVTWDHGAGLLGSKVIGTATFKQLTDEGLEFLIRVTEEQAGRYKELVDWAYQRSLLGLSSQTLATMFDYDWSTGIIKSWRIGELALTVTPADVRTRDALRQQARSIGLLVGDEPMSLTDVVHDIARAVDAAVDAPVEVEPVAQVAAEVVAEVEAAVEADVVAELQQALADVSARLDAMQATMPTKADLEALGSRVANLQTGFTDAFRSLGDVLARRIKGLAAEEIASASTVEKTAIKEVVSTPQVRTPIRPGMDKSGVPLNMPGR